MPIDILERIIYNTATNMKVRMSRMKSRLVLPLCALAMITYLSSCIGIESRIDLRADGTGTLTLSYRVSQFMKNIDVGREDKRLPLPVSAEDFRRTAAGIEGLRLATVEQREDEQDVHIRAVLEFDDLEALNALGPESGLGLSFARSGEDRVLRQQIAPAAEPEMIPESSFRMVEEFFAGYELVYTISAPGAIKRHTLGELSEDGRSVIYTVTVPQLLRAVEPVVLEVVW